MKTSVNQRLDTLISALGLTKNAFAKSLGVTSTQIYNIINGRNAPSFDLLQKIAIEYPSVNIVWLLTDRGNVINGKSESSQESNFMINKMKLLEEKISKIAEEVGTRTKLKEEEAFDIVRKVVSKKKA